jgi:hypothetical protein
MEPGLTGDFAVASSTAAARSHLPHGLTAIAFGPLNPCGHNLQLYIHLIRIVVVALRECVAQGEQQLHCHLRRPAAFLSVVAHPSCAAPRLSKLTFDTIDCRLVSRVAPV